MKIWVRFLMLTFPLALLIMLSTYLFSKSEQNIHLNAVRLETAHHIESQATNISEEVKRAISHVQYLGQSKELIEALEGDKEAFSDMSDHFYGFVKYLGVYDQLRLLDKQGQEVIRANYNAGKVELVSPAKLQNKQSSVYFQKSLALQKGEVFISSFDLNMEHGKIQYPLKSVIRYAVPTFDELGDHVGVLVLNYRGQVLIQRYLDATDVMGENMLMNANGLFIHIEDKAMIWGEDLGDRGTLGMPDRFPKVWDAIVSERYGQLLTDAGLFTFATISPYEILGQQPPEDGAAGDWIIVSYVTSNELLKASNSSLVLYVSGSSVLFALWAILAWFWVRSEAHRQQAFLHLEQLSQQKRHLLRRQLNMQEEERHILARALHDDMGQSLTSIQAYAAAIKKASAHGKLDMILSSSSHIRS
ncbi:MAG: histidine kinase, partial [Mariprofundaceae bacterium]